jgi:hypothetical protein
MTGLNLLLHAEPEYVTQWSVTVDVGHSQPTYVLQVAPAQVV